jgi:Arc/MetJ-type ribon-helix-helix transcriptional regulator
MKKINLYLTNFQHQELKNKAHNDDVSMSELVREAIDEYLTSKKRSYDFDPHEDSFFKAIGTMRSEETDLSVNHDKYLYEDPKD